MSEYHCLRGNLMAKNFIKNCAINLLSFTSLWKNYYRQMHGKVITQLDAFPHHHIPQVPSIFSLLFINSLEFKLKEKKKKRWLPKL